MNCVQLSGRLVKDPDIKYNSNGTAITTFTLAVRDREDHTDFIPIVCYGKTAENVANYKKQGDYIIVVGKIHQSKWETSDGQKRSKLEIYANKIEFVVNKKENDENTTESNEQDFIAVDDEEDDIPF